ncbi:cation diffusion facilitator family transporter [Polaribacter sp.]|uniref:cation diffusion facilitator family transporter n=1 Tax=Polaribacter sp. TaxID=1920175 RepID=UPI003F6D8105
MVNNHSHSHHHSTKNIGVAFFLNLFFTIIEFIGGYYTNSLAITSDAVHDLGDSLSLGMAWYFQKISTKKPTKKFSYGYQRFSLLGAIINTIILLIGSVFIITEAIPRILHPETADAKGMMWFAFLGIIVNGAAVFKLKKGVSLNEKVVMLHLLEDVLGWCAVLIASIIMQFYNVPILDPILSVLIALFVLYNVFKNGKKSIRIILQATPLGISVDKIQNKILKNKEIKSVYDCHIWSMDGEYNVFTAHLVLADKTLSLKTTEALKAKIKKDLQADFNLKHITLELEIK